MSDNKLPKFATAGKSLDKRLAEATVGLVTKEEYANKRKELEARGDRTNTKRQKKQKKTPALSFQDSDDEATTTTTTTIKRYGEDKERLAKEAAEKRRAVEQEYEAKKAAELAETLVVAYNVYPERRRYTETVTQATTIAQFVQQCINANTELKTVADAMFVKEDLILPPDTRFYDLLTVRAEGRSGKLCEFGTVVDEGGRRKTTAIVCAKWYALNKEAPPAKDWEHFDFSKNYRKDWKSGQTGDWNCPNCKTLNWGSKNPTKCMRCGDARPTFSTRLV